MRATQKRAGAAGKGVYPWVIHTRNKVQRSYVSQCVVGGRLRGQPYCRTFDIESDNISLRSMMQLLACPGTCQRLSVTGAALKETEAYPRAMGLLMAHALSMPWFVGREYVL